MELLQLYRKEKKKNLSKLSFYCPFTYWPNIYCVPTLYMSDTLFRAEPIKDFLENGKEGMDSKVTLEVEPTGPTEQYLI